VFAYNAINVLLSTGALKAIPKEGTITANEIARITDLDESAISQSITRPASVDEYLY
jgi:F0F1-type ATP synthase epsilon subunit